MSVRYLGLAILSSLTMPALCVGQIRYAWMPPAERLQARAMCVEKALSARLNFQDSLRFIPASREQAIPPRLRSEQFATIGGHVNVIYVARVDKEGVDQFLSELRRNRGRFVTSFGSLHIRRYAIAPADDRGIQDVFVLAHLDRADPYGHSRGLFKHFFVDVVYGNFAQFILQEHLDSSCESSAR